MYMNSKITNLLLHLRPDDAEPLRDQIVRQLRDRIVRADLAAGDRLPGFRALARQLRVAPSTVESAYGALAAEGLIEVASPDDARVATLDPERRRQLMERQQLDKLVAEELGRRELEMARDVQRRLLPPTELTGPGWQVAARYQPARVMAGDFYDVLQRADGSLDLIVADVAGKGFAASLIMASVKAMLPFVTHQGGVADSLTRLNRRLAAELGRGEFVALTLARYNPRRAVIDIANAGAPDPYLLRFGDSPQPLSVPGPRLPLGVRDEVTYESASTELADGEALLLLTDGLPETRDATGGPIGYDEFESLIAAAPDAETSSDWLSGLFDRVQLRSGRTPEDDWTAALLVPRNNLDSS
jgi:sigma-B regulation protein RsbU (phosphoserine phosphatase)